MLKSILLFFAGLLISAGMVALGFLLTKLTETGAPLFISVPMVPLVGFYLFKKNKSKIGIGMLTIAPVLIFLLVIFLILSSLH